MRAARGVLAGCALVALAAGCGRKGLAPDPIPTPPPPIVEATFPAARSVRVHYDTAIWARFAEPLDPLTVDERTVFFKVDTRRIPADVTWDGPGRRIVIVPYETLDLNTTHTVRLSTAIRTATGVPLAGEISWQFKTMSVRLPAGEWPPQGVANKGPWTTLTWKATEPAAGFVTYSVYAGTDSAEVARRATPIARPWLPVYRPDPSWPLGAPVYWTVSAMNATTAETIDGPIASFHTLPDGLPIDSLDVPPSEWGYHSLATPNLHPCFADLVTGGGYTAAARYPLASIPPGLEIAAARIDVSMAPATWPFLSTASAMVFVARNEWTACTIVPGFPTFDTLIGQLAAATVLAGGRLRYDSPVFVAYVQTVIPSGAPLGLVFRSERTLTYWFMNGPVEARLRLQYYRLPAPGPNAAIPAVASSHRVVR